MLKVIATSRRQPQNRERPREGALAMESKDSMSFRVEPTESANLPVDDKIVWNEFPQPQAGPKGEAHGCAEQQKPHRRPSRWGSRHTTTQLKRGGGQGKCGDCAGKVHPLIRGDLFVRHRGSRRAILEGPPDEQRTWRSGGRPAGSERTSRTRSMP